LVGLLQAQEADRERRCKVFVKCGYSNVTETKLFVARRTETRSRPTNQRPLCFIFACQIPNFPHKVWLPEPLYLDTPYIVIRHRIMSGDRRSIRGRSNLFISSGKHP
jgi:hypothetical protein